MRWCLLASMAVLSCKDEANLVEYLDGGARIHPRPPSDPRAFKLCSIPCDGFVDDGTLGHFGECFPRGTTLLLRPGVFDAGWSPCVHARVEIQPYDDGSGDLTVH